MKTQLPEDFTSGQVTDCCPICSAEEGKEFWARMFHAMTALRCKKCGLDEWVWND